jgi:hypothetical protein
MTIQNNDIFFYLLISALAVAGAAVLWRNILENHPKLKASISNILGKADKVLLCGSCFTYWLSLVFVLIFNPLSGLVINAGNKIFQDFSHCFISWMALGMMSVIIRFGYVAIQELVSYQVHKLHDNH